MFVLCGFTASNYYNKVKLALLEKGVAFTEELVPSGKKSELVLEATPLGKVPFIRTEHGTLCESQVIMDYIEARHPTPPLMPADPWQAAKVREPRPSSSCTWSCPRASCTRRRSSAAS